MCSLLTRDEITLIRESGSSSFLLNMARMKMKMAAVSKITLLLLCSSIITSTDSKDDCNNYATTGGNFTVLLNHKLTAAEKLRWKLNTTTIFNRGVSKTGMSITTGNVNDIHPNGSLRLTNLKKNQGGIYYPEVFTAEGKAVQNLKRTNLCIYDPVPTPHLTAKCYKSKVEYTCTVGSKQDGLIFEWLQNDKPLEKKTTDTLSLDLKQAQKGSVKCKVSNKASTTTISNATEQPCKTGGFVFPEKIFGHSVWIFVGSGGGIVLVLIITTIVCCVLAKKRNRMQLKDEEELRLGWTNTQQPHQHDRHQHNHPPDHPHHHHHHQQQQPAGHTGPRQHRTKQQRPRAPEPTNGQPQPTPRRAAQTPRPVVNDDDEQPPPLPQPRKKAPKTPRM